MDELESKQWSQQGACEHMCLPSDRGIAEMLQGIVRHSPGFMAVFDLEFRFEAVNEAYLSEYGVSEQDVLGKYFLDVFPERSPEWSRIHAQLLRGEEESLVFDSWVCRPWRDECGAICGMLQCRSASTVPRKAVASGGGRREWSLLDSVIQHARSQVILDHISNGVVVFDSRARQVYMNDMTAQIYGFERAEIAQLNLHDLAKVFFLESYPKGERLAQEQWPSVRVLSGESLDGLVCRLKHVGRDRERIISVSGTPVFDAAGQVEYAIMVTQDISERIHAEVALREAKEDAEQQKAQWKAILDHISNGVAVYGSSADLIYMNDAEANIFGFDLGDEDSWTWEQLTANYVLQSYPERQNLRSNEWPIHRVLSGKEIHNETFFVRRVGGDFERVVVLSGTPVYNPQGEVEYAVLVTQDISERMQAENAMRQEKLKAERGEAQLEAVLSHVNSGIIALDMDSKVVHLNDTFARILGYRSKNEIPRDSLFFETSFCFYSYPDHEEVPIEDWPLGHLRGKKSVRDIVYYVKRLDSMWERVVTCYGTTVRSVQGEAELELLVIHDITEKVEREERDRLLQERMEQTQRLESLGVLAGGIAHDFNNLLMAIVGHADLALMELSPLSPVAEDIGEIKTSSKRAAELCSQLLAYSGKGKLEEKSFSISELVHEMLHMLKTCISKKCMLTLDMEDDLPLTEGDPSQMRQIIMNFVINASEAIGDLSGVISVSTGVMECSLEYLQNGYVLKPSRPGRYVTLEVSDNGTGMDHETLQRIFEPFFTTKFSGRGLGLSATLGIIRSHGGGLRVYSEPGIGTTFKVLFPVVNTGNSFQRLNLEEGGSDVFWHGQGMVLLVDDEETVRAICSRQLARLGLNVLTAVNGQEAVDIYRKKQDEISLVILDLTMPKMGGEEAFRELRAINPEVKVVLASGYTKGDVVSRFSGKKISGFLRKPYTLGELSVVLSELLPQT